MRAPARQWGLGVRPWRPPLPKEKSTHGNQKEWKIMTISKNGKGQVIVVAKQLIAGTGKHLSSATPVAFAGGSFTGDQITSKLQALVDLRSEVDAAKATAK